MTMITTLVVIAHVITANIYIAVKANARGGLTMDEYIKREDAIKAIENDLPEQVRYSREDAADCIRYMDAADVAPVRHGRWIEQEQYTFGVMYDCSICNNRILDNGHSWNYCPNCGAKMDGEDQKC